MRTLLVDNRVETVLGPPDVMVYGLGDARGSDPDPMTDRTVYTVWETKGLTSVYSHWCMYGDSVENGQLRSMSPNTGSMATNARFDMKGGSTNAGIAIANSRALGLHVGVMSVSKSCTRIEFQVDDKIGTPRVITPGEGIVGSRLRTLNAANNDTPLFASAYNTNHTPEEIEKMFRFLRARFGVPTP